MKPAAMTAGSLALLAILSLALSGWAVFQLQVPLRATSTPTPTPTPSVAQAEPERPRMTLSEPPEQEPGAPGAVSGLRIKSHTNTRVTITWKPAPGTSYVLIWVDGNLWSRTTKNVVVLPAQTHQMDVFVTAFSSNDKGSATRKLSILPATVPTPSPKPPGAPDEP